MRIEDELREVEKQNKDNPAWRKLWSDLADYVERKDFEKAIILAPQFGEFFEDKKFHRNQFYRLALDLFKNYVPDILRSAFPHKKRKTISLMAEIVTVCRENPELTNEEIFNLISPVIDERQFKRHLSELRKAGLIPNRHPN